MSEYGDFFIISTSSEDEALAGYLNQIIVLPDYADVVISAHKMPIRFESYAEACAAIAFIAVNINSDIAHTLSIRCSNRRVPDGL